MRDNFNKQTIETLSKRVGLHCSNPNCRTLTMGPNSNHDKATNIGVAAHITAASIKGPRYDSKLSSEDRKSINNAIWLCQSCAKLIDSDPKKYTVTELINWKQQAELLTEAELNKITSKKDLPRLFNLMPELINELIDDVKENPLLRELILLKKGWVYNHGGKLLLVYYYEDHSDLEAKMQLLESNDLINDRTYNNTKRYVLTEEFVDILSQMNKL